ncbi:hypothetical protein I79_007902 [Cricetulus griseus]|uniref:Uncharacterized protein n=1 Tax=Cricetulus griseus TaxID=10029 RepID=G3HBV2_CRIGR|nr:hypothetical protein I79_007902 [Cricetulus griseus]
MDPWVPTPTVHSSKQQTQKAFTWWCTPVILRTLKQRDLKLKDILSDITSWRPA